MNKSNVNSCIRICSKTIRSSFLDYFSNQGHSFVRSSPVVPFCDSSIAFVNSGMCQFKNVFLGLAAAPYPRVANSQKCIRVGGKHNDLSCAGRDTYHHTFFEMLGNWSFNDYYKQDACRMAFDFLTKPPISLPLSRLYFTYFGGNDQYGLPCDVETRNIWLELGVPQNQLKKEGMKSNFWEMGGTGPCGYSSEIHFDLRGDSQSALSRVNADVSDLIEIWNIVFISHNRVSSESIIPLSKNFVDTGLGFERFVTILQGKTSTYDTDLFVPLLETISKVSGMKPYAGSFVSSSVPDLDTSYRMLSDYSRMITVALADNMFPDATAKLRNVVRAALTISEDVFKVKQGKLIKELTYNIAEILGGSYPEIQESLNKVQLIVSEEARIFDNLRSGAMKEWNALVSAQPALNQFNIMEEPGLVLGVKFLDKLLVRDPSLVEISGEVAFTLYDTYGLSRDVIKQLAFAKNLTLDEATFEDKLNQLKNESKESSARNMPVIDPLDLQVFPLTDDRSKYEYHYNTDSNSYVFPSLDNKLIGVVIGEQVFCIDSDSIRHTRSGASIDTIQLEPTSWIGLIFDRTNFYTQAGGQIDDIGMAHLSCHSTGDSTKVEIGELVTLDGRIIHYGSVVSEFKITPGLESRVEVDAKLRSGCMRAHTTSHLLNAALRQVLTCTYQRSCRVSPDVCALDFSVYGETFGVDSVATVEKYINDVISGGMQVNRKIITSSELTGLSHVTLIPGEVYPDDVILIDISKDTSVISREPCCGTHVLNTGHIESCTLIGYKSHNHGVRSIKCLTGNSSKAAIINGKQLSAKVKDLEVAITYNPKQLDEQSLKQQKLDLQTLKKTLTADVKEIPFIVQKQSSLLLTELSKTLKLKMRRWAKTSVADDLKQLCREDRPYFVHYINDNDIEVQAFPPLSEISKPVLVILNSAGELKARTYVPPQYISSEFNAQTWLTPVLARADGKGSSGKGIDPNTMHNMGPVKIAKDAEAFVNELIETATRTAEKLLSKSK